MAENIKNEEKELKDMVKKEENKKKPFLTEDGTLASLGFN